MSVNESGEVQSSGRTSTAVELLLDQMTLRGPSDQLDAAIESLAATDEAKVSFSAGVRFGWPVILATAVATVLSGIWLGSIFLPTNGNLSTGMAAGDSGVNNAKLLTAVSFNVHAFNLLHGHSQKAEFENCGQCHQLASAEGDALSDIFDGWFYGDEHFFEVHLDGIDDCTSCHLASVDEKSKPAMKVPGDFSSLVRCSECHRVDSSGFGGFKLDWRYSGSSSEG